jgi:hypothetical protein
MRRVDRAVNHTGIDQAREERRFGFDAADRYNARMPTSAVLSPHHRRMLAEMGIDVWLRRAAVAAEPAAVAAPTTTPQPTPSTQPTLTVPIDALPTPAPVELECIAAPGAIVMGAFASAADRRLAQDVLLAVAGPSAKVVRTQFRWPQTQTADRSPSAARSAFAGFLRGQTERTSASCVLLLGSAATALLEGAFTLDGCDVLRLPDAAVLRGDAAQKKTLWLTISHLARR